MKIIVINGMPRAGKDEFVKMCEEIESKNMKVADYVQTEFIEDKRQTTPYHIIIFAKKIIMFYTNSYMFFL